MKRTKCNGIITPNIQNSEAKISKKCPFNEFSGCW